MAIESPDSRVIELVRAPIEVGMRGFGVRRPRTRPQRGWSPTVRVEPIRNAAAGEPRTRRSPAFGPHARGSGPDRASVGLPFLARGRRPATVALHSGLLGRAAPTRALPPAGNRRRRLAPAPHPSWGVVRLRYPRLQRAEPRLPNRRLSRGDRHRHPPRTGCAGARRHARRAGASRSPGLLLEVEQAPEAERNGDRRAARGRPGRTRRARGCRR